MLPKACGIIDFLAEQQVPQAMPALGRTGRVEARLADIRLAGDLANAGESIVGVQPHDKHVLRAIGNFRDIRQAQVKGVDLSNFHRCGRDTA